METPRKAPLATNSDYQSGNLDTRRAAVLKHIGLHVPEVSTEFFLRSFIPPVSSAHVDQVETRLGKGKHLVNLDGQRRWSAFELNPSEMPDREDKAFAPFDSIWSSIVRMGEKVLQKSPTLAFGQNPDHIPVSDRDELARPDGQCTFLDPDTKKVLDDLGISHSYYANVVLWELKKHSNEKDTSDNIKKVTWGCHNTLLTDPRRRFVFGITIEDTLMRVWYFSRTYIIATKHFDFVQDRKTLIQVILGLAFATPEELGFDNTMSLHAEILPDETQVIQFKMRVNDKTYITCNPLSDYSADAIRGRGMRVWEVKEEGSSDHYVIKDVWILGDSLSEGSQLRQLYELLENVPASPDGRKPTDYFLTLVADEYIKVSDGREDDTRIVMMRDQDLPEDAGHIRLIPAPVRSSRSQPSQLSRPSHGGSHPSRMRGSGTMTMRARVSGLPMPSPAPVQLPAHTKYRSRKHYRIVFLGVGVTLYKVPTLFGTLSALADAAAGLKILHDLKLVHRDISPGNILVLDGTGKLSDLEYMKPFGGFEPELETIAVEQLEPSEHKTGNTQFTAVEVEYSQLYFVPHQGPSGEILERPGSEHFSFIPLHDLESLMWILLWVLSHYTAGEALKQEQWEIANRYFDGAELSQRRGFLDATKISPSNFPQEFSRAVKSLNDVRSALVGNYVRFETALAVNLAQGISVSGDFDGIHQTFIDIYAHGAAGSADVSLFDEAPAEEAQSDSEAEPLAKRART
ncbi:hypothetical protein C8R46DRAFT_942924 [Mycena filopes]|nr:hypothetical protein C8R46DRAFT_942924 [Mycena filopes]